MSDLISRAAAIYAIVNTVSDVGLHDNSETARYGATYRQQEIVTILKSLSSAERKKGKWKAKSFHECFCDNCGFSFDIMNCDFLENMIYCPNCGAKMEGAK